MAVLSLFMWDSNKGKWEKKNSWKLWFSSSLSGRLIMMLMAIFFLRIIAGFELQLSSDRLNISSVLLMHRHTQIHLTYLSSVSSDFLLVEHKFRLTSEAWGRAEDWWPGYGAIAAGNCWHSHCWRRNQVRVGEWPINCSEMLEKEKGEFRGTFTL